MSEYISRQEVLETIRYRVCQGQGNKEHMCKLGSCAYCGIMEIMSDISSIEAADVQPVKHGRWIIDYAEGTKIYHAHCSECEKEPTRHIGGDYYIDKLSDFCPNCGSKNRMDGDNE